MIKIIFAIAFLISIKSNNADVVESKNLLQRLSPKDAKPSINFFFSAKFLLKKFFIVFRLF